MAFENPPLPDEIADQIRTIAGDQDDLGDGYAVMVSKYNPSRACGVNVTAAKLPELTENHYIVPDWETADLMREAAKSWLLNLN